MDDPLGQEENVSINTVVRERRTLREWKDTVSLRTPNFLLHYSELVEHLESFPPSKIDVSPNGDVLALMSHNRELEIYALFEESIAARARVKVLEERYPEYCLLKFTASGSLLLSTRSNAIIDVFEPDLGGYCYSIAVSKTVESFDAAEVICEITSISPDTETTKYLDTLYTLQYGSVFSCYKLGLLVGYISLFKVNLGLGLTTSFVHLPSVDLIIVAGQHRSFGEVAKLDCNQVGLNVYRIVTEEPYIVDVRVSKTQISFFEVLSGWLPFKRLNNGIIISMASNRSYSQLSVVSSTGDVFIFDLPSMRLVKHIVYDNIAPRIIQTVWIDEKEIAYLTRRGTLLRGNVNDIEKFLMEKPEDVEIFEENSMMLSPKVGIVFALESKVLSSEGSRSTKKNRAWLAAKLRLTTIYDYMKAYIDAAIGQPLIDVPEAVENREVLLALHEIRSVTLQHVLEKMLMHGDFEKALELTHKHRFDNIDFIYKEQWRRLGENVTEKSVKNVLAHVSDRNWVCMQCLESRAQDMQTHWALIELAKEITSGNLDPQRALILHCERILHIVQASNKTQSGASVYVELRSKSFLEIAIYFAKMPELDLFEKHLFKDPILRPHLFTLLWLIPEVTSPERYEFLIPYNVNQWFAIDYNESERSSLELCSLAELLPDCVNKLNYRSLFYENNVYLSKFTNSEELKLTDLLDFLKARCFEIDTCTGLIDLIVDFVQLCIAHGFKEMDDFLRDVMFYRDFVVFCGLISLSLEQFNSSASDVIFNAIEKHMTEDDVCANIARILELLEYLFACGRCSSLESQLNSFLCFYSKCSLRVFESACKLRPAWINQEIIISCFSKYEVVGKKLVEETKKAGLPLRYVNALVAFSEHHLEPAFEQLHHSFIDVALARQLLYRFIRAAQCSTYSQWKKLKDDLLEIYFSFYSTLFTEEEILRMFADELLNLSDFRQTRELVGLVLFFGVSDKEAHVLSLGASLDLLLQKSEDFYNSAMPDRKDANLRLAHEILFLIPKECAGTKSRLTKHLRLLDAFDVALGLNCTMLPIKFKHSDPETLFGDIVKIGENYKKLKECAKLAQLLNIRTPVARSMELCAVEALLRKDVKSLRKYCEALLKISENKSLPQGMHSLCIDVFKSGLLADMDNELLTCAVLSSPPEDILDTLSLAQDRGIEGDIASTSFVKPTSELVLDPVYTRVEEYFLSNKVTPMIADNPTVYVDALKTKDEAAFLNAVANLARHYTHVSATVALNLSLMLPEEEEWTENIVLAKYSRAIRLSLRELTFKQIQLLPPLYLVEKYAKTVIGETALQRILNSGCDRERFFEDFEYRDETLNGIAMTTDPFVIKDCIEVAEKYRMDTWSICFSALEYLLTDPETCSVNLRETLLNLEVLERLRLDTTRFYSSLRSGTLSAVLAASDSNERIKAYLSLFGEEQQEYRWLKALNYFSSILKECDLAAFLSKEPSRIVSQVFPFLNDYCVEVTENLLLLPDGSNICDSIAFNIFSNEQRSLQHLRKCFILLGKDCEKFIDMIGTLPVAEEVSYLQFVVERCSFEREMSFLRAKLVERLELLQEIPEPSLAFHSKPEATTSPTGFLRRRHH